jgi:hypothetical protein
MSTSMTRIFWRSEAATRVKAADDGKRQGRIHGPSRTHLASAFWESHSVPSPNPEEICVRRCGRPAVSSNPINQVRMWGNRSSAPRSRAVVDDIDDLGKVSFRTDLQVPSLEGQYVWIRMGRALLMAQSGPDRVPCLVAAYQSHRREQSRHHVNEEVLYFHNRPW